MLNQWKLFEKVTKHQNFDLLWGPEWPRNWTFGAHIVHISESSPNGHIKQDWSESTGNFFRKYSKTLIMTHLESKSGPKIWASGAYLLHTYKVAPISFWIKFQVNERNFHEIDKTLYINLFWPYLGPKMVRKFGPQRPYFTHTWKYPATICLYTKFHGPVFKKMAKNLKKKAFFYLFFVIKDPLKNSSKKKKILFAQLWGQYCCAHSPNIGKIGWTYSIWKKMLTDGRLGVG